MRIDTIDVDLDEGDLLSVERHDDGAMTLRVLAAHGRTLALWIPASKIERLREAIAPRVVRI